MSIKDKVTGEVIEIRTLKFTLPKDTRDFVQGILDMYKELCWREYGQEINNNKALEFMAEEIRQLHQDELST